MNYPIWHPFTQHGLEQAPLKIKKAEGAYLYTEDGRKILDGISSWWVNCHGHCHPHIVKAVQNQAAQLEQVIFAGFTHAAAENLAHKLLEFTHRPTDKVFFSDSGSTSVEVALKMAIGHWEHLGRPRRKILALEGGYHGDTFGTMSAGSRSVFNRLYEPFLFDVIHLPSPSDKNCLNILHDILKRHGHDIAAFVFEPLVQGAGGMRMYDAAILKKICTACEKYEIVLIADEVMTGFGRTGTRFACEQVGLVPDILCLSKGLTGGFLPMGATIATDKIYKAFYHQDRAKMFYHSSSYTGNALACAAALANLEIWEQEPVQARIDVIATSHQNALGLFSGGSRFENPRSLGTIFAVDIKNAEDGYLSGIGPKLYEYFLKRDVLLRPLGNVIYILPPYCVSTEALNMLYGIIEDLKISDVKHI